MLLILPITFGPPNEANQTVEGQIRQPPHQIILSAMPMDKRRWRRTESSDAGTTTGDSSTSNSNSSCFNNNRPIVIGTKSILKSSSESASAAVPSADCATTSSSPRLGTRLRHAAAATAAVNSAFQRRQHSIDAKMPASSSGARAVTFFLESESSESSFAGRADEPTMTTEDSKAYRQHHRLSRHWSPRSQQNGAFRRTSLPVQSNSARHNLLLQSQVNSARGILMDLLATNRGDLSPDVTACLKAVTALLNPASPTHQQTSAAATGCCANVGGVITNLSLTELGVPSVVESPYSGEVHIALFHIELMPKRPN
uniref:Uncharacterized protein n=1 Tax=Globodera rostochiensis TaxID=31243 RepID=A0A914HLR3_GLORO